MTFEDFQQTEHRIIFIQECRQKAWGAACHAEWISKQMDDLMAVADNGGIMPPKSTWFEPKLADGMVNHVLD